MENYNSKQVLIWRADLRNFEGHKVRSGKIVAQLSHASLKAMLSKSWLNMQNENVTGIVIPLTDPYVNDWMTNRFTKVCLVVNSEQELLEIYEKAKEAGLLCSLIQDAGLTEFGNIPTYTAVGIGPGNPKEIDRLTNHLHLL